MKNGFTLAEVLITLAIIGIVAALTIPNFVAQYRKKVYVAQLKKSYTTIQNGFKMLLADEGVSDLRDTSLTAALNGSYYGCDTDDDYTNFENILKKYFQITKFALSSSPPSYNCTITHLKNGYYRHLNNNIDDKDIADYDNRKIYLADGSIIGLYYYSAATMDGCIASIVVDVNGENKGPNQWGRDTFWFDLKCNGSLIPMNHWNSGDCNIENDGATCALRIMENGWIMDY